MKTQIKITNEEISELNKIITSISIRHLPMHAQIDYLMQDVLGKRISYDDYRKKYNEILKLCQKDLKLFRYKICLVYIYNVANKKHNEEEYQAFRTLLTGIHRQIEINVFDKRIIEYINNFDIDESIKQSKITDTVVAKDEQLIENPVIGVSVRLFNKKLASKQNKQKVKTSKNSYLI